MRFTKRSWPAGAKPAGAALAGVLLLCAMPLRSTSVRREVVRIFQSSWVAVTDGHAATGETPAEGQLLERLAGLGPEAFTPLLALADGTDTTLLAELAADGDPPIGALGRVGAVSGRAIARMPVDFVVSRLRGTADPAVPLETRMTAIGILGGVGSERCLESVLAIASTIDPLHLTYRSVRRSLEAALGEILRREAGVWDQLTVALVMEMEPALREIFVDALSTSGRRQALGLFLDLLDSGFEPALDAMLVEGVVALYLTLPWCFDESVTADLCDRLELRLTAEDSRVRRAAVVCLGRLGSVEVVAVLVELLADVDPAEARDLDQALRQISGTTTPSDAWPSWFEEQEEWRYEHEDDALEQLLDEDPARVVRALGELSQRSLLDRAAIDAIVETLEHPRAEAVLAALSALELIGAPHVAPRVLLLLESDDERIVRKAVGTLQRLTFGPGTDDVDTWQRFLQL